jgi:hypothetical protein
MRWASALVVAGLAAGAAAGPAGGVAIPRAACVAPQRAGLVAVFDVRVTGRRSVLVAARRNVVRGGRVLGRRPTRFAPGLTRSALRARFVRRRVSWRLGRRTATLSRTSRRCRPPADARSAPGTGAPTRPVAVAADATPTPRPIFAPTSFWNRTIPPDAAYATDSLKVGTNPDGTAIMAPVNPTVANELAADATKPDGTPNARIYHRSFTAPITTVPAGTPLQPVRLCRSYPSGCVPSWGKHLDLVLRGVATNGTYLGGGVPIPDGFTLPPDGDRDAILYQPDYVAPNGRHGRLYELWGLQPNPDYDPTHPVSPTNARLMARWGGRMVGVTGEGAGYWRDCWWSGCGYQADTSKDPSAWGRPNGQAQEKSWGVTASSLPLLGDEISLAECQAGVIDHAIGLQVPAARRQYWAPAQRTDGLSWSTTLTEGMRLTVPAGTLKPAGLTAVGSSLWDAAQRYGLVIDDQSGSAITLRVEPGCEATAWWGGLDDYAELANFPWDDLRVLAH